MKKRILSLILVLVLCVGVFAGCQSSALKSYLDEEESPAAGTPAPEAKNYDAVFASYSPDLVMLTINGLDVTWQELFYWYHYIVTTIESYSGEITDWDAISAVDENQTYREFVMDYVLETTKVYRTLESKAIELGLELSREDEAELDTIWQNNVSSYGGTDEEFEEYLDSVYMTKTLFYYFNKVSLLHAALLNELYGENGEKLDEEEVVAEAESRDLVRAKHLLFKTVDDSYASLGDEVKAEKLAAAEAALAELQAIEDPAALEARIDEMMAEISEDTGSLYYTDGYTFGPGEMDTAFEAAAYELEDYGISGIVEGFYGYHIIMRLPLSATAIMEYGGETDIHTLAYVMSQYIFSAALDSWAAESVEAFGLPYSDMDIAELFAKAK